MIVPLNSPLEGIAADRFISVARSLARVRSNNEAADCRGFLEQEIAWCRNNALLNGSQLAYEASIRVLLDLVRLGWQVREEGYGIELVAAKGTSGSMSPESILAEKQRTRALFQPIVDGQFRDENVQAFVRKMESPAAASRKKSVCMLIADGEELHARIKISSESAEDGFREAIQPYLQLVTTEETDEFTGHGLREIWRYFRYSWSIPQFATPGRQLLYLVRDAAHPCHAVMGIIGLNNCALQMGTARESYLGWNLDAVRSRLLDMAVQSPASLPSEIAWMENQIASALDEVHWTGLVRESEVINPGSDLIAQLRRKAKEFDTLRDEALRDFAVARSGGEMASYAAETEDLLYGHPPVSDEMLDLEAKPGTKPEMQKARRHLVARKRAALLSDLLHARMILKKHHARLCSAETIAQALETDELQVAINTVLAALKSRFAGINMLEISTCGAIPPYNHLLSGKLASLLLFSPQIGADYRRIYGGPSIIASQMKNEAVRRPNELVYLGTTSLYAQGSSQYERLKLPAGTIAPDQPELRFTKIGTTSGYGTLQFPAETREAVERHLTTVQAFRDVNSIFGEGPSPKLRKLVAGLRSIGFPPDSLMRHNRPRLIYSVPLCPQALDYLNARPCKLPSYISSPEELPDATDHIIDFWKSRWLSSRLKHQPSLIALLGSRSWKLSDRMSLETNFVSGPAGASAQTRPVVSTIWHLLATSSPKVTSDALSPEELSALHIAQPVDDFLRDRVSKGFSVFLTGNAGDGKTHLLRRLRDDLIAVGAEVVEDASALMRHNNMNPILDRWRKAVADGRPFCIAINEYPLYRLRMEAERHLPELAAELARQTSQSLAYGTETADEGARKNILILDLSLRNPLRRNFASTCLKRILDDDTLAQHALPGSPLAWNLQHLKDPTVQSRLMDLFERLAYRGVRATVRELWIVLARIVLGYRADLDLPTGEGMGHWYSETLFQQDRRFPLFDALRACDPAAFSHPVWDAQIEEACPSLTSGWALGTPRPRASVRPERTEFVALKRAFYFEHAQGTDCFALEPPDLSDYRVLLENHTSNDAVARNQIIEAINRAYAPVSFPGIADNLYLWNGHRFHEQPSEVFLANRRIPSDTMQLLCPRLPSRVRDAFHGYCPDHLALVYNTHEGAPLKIDSYSFATLRKLRRGLPRKLLADRDTFRLEAFLDQLHRVAPAPERKILSAHLKRRELIEVQLSPDGKVYERITKP